MTDKKGSFILGKGWACLSVYSLPSPVEAMCRKLGLRTESRK